MGQVRLKVLCVIGTRPELIKMAPVVRALEVQKEHVETMVVATGQHREMLLSLMGIMAVRVDRYFDIMRTGQSLTYIMSAVMRNLDDLIKLEKPHLVLVQGDTSSALAAALAAFYNRVPVGHIEAGLRTYDSARPFPEEMNRRMVDQIAELFFAPTTQARENLLREGVELSKIELTGNTVVDALLRFTAQPGNPVLPGLEAVPFASRKVILTTIHRRENFGRPLEDVCVAIRDLVLERPDLFFLVPVHPNPQVRETVEGILSGQPGIALVPPLDYPAFIGAMQRSFLILSDSGGVQEEAPVLGRPVLLLRDVTERPEAVAAGAVRIVGTSGSSIRAAILELLADSQKYMAMTQARFLYGDGTAGEKIVRRILAEKDRLCPEA